MSECLASHLVLSEGDTSLLVVEHQLGVLSLEMALLPHMLISSDRTLDRHGDPETRRLRV